MHRGPLSADLAGPLQGYDGRLQEQRAVAAHRIYAGLVNTRPDPPKLDAFNGAVDIDVSYVDTVFLPTAMAPYNPQAPALNQVAYVGTPIPINTFRAALTSSLGRNHLTSAGRNSPLMGLARRC